VSAPLIAKGHNGQLTVSDTEVVITRKGFLAFLTQGLKGEKTIRLADISAVQFKDAGLFTNGYIQLSFLGGQENKRGLFDATKDENTVMFTKSQAEVFRAARDRIQSARSAPNSRPTKRCPACAEDVLAEASICRYCRHLF
jgi:hypothetical protein